MEIVKNSGKSVVLLVLDEASYKKAEKEGVNLEDLGQKVSKGQQQQKKQQQQATPPMANGAITPALQPRLCYLVKEEKGYGFSLKTIEGESSGRGDGMYVTAETEENTVVGAHKPLLLAEGK